MKRMYLLLLCLCLLGTVLQHHTAAESTFDAKVRLEKILLKNYTREARPVRDVRDNVTITVGISLYLIRNMVWLTKTELASYLSSGKSVLNCEAVLNHRQSKTSL